MPPKKILFVCLGNICRSPSAEIICQQLAGQNKEFAKQATIDSCGTASYHIGGKPDARMLRALARKGYPYTGHKARQFNLADFARFDLIIPQDESNKADLLRLARTDEERKKIQAMSEFFPPSWRKQLSEVPDPYYGGQEGFDQVVELLEASCAALLAHIAPNFFASYAKKNPC